MGVVETAGLVLSGVGFIGQQISSRKAAKQQEKAARAQERQQKLEQQLQRRRAAREARLKTGAAINAAELQGAGSSTVAAGTAASIQTQLSGNLSFLNQSDRLISQATRANIAASRFQSRAATFGSISNLGLSVFSNAAKIEDRFSDLFGDNRPTDITAKV